MGGNNYDGDVGERTRAVETESFFNYTQYGRVADAPRPTIDPSLDLKRKQVRECVQENPIIVAPDLTLSRGTDIEVFYAKLPMFMGQLQMRAYVTEPAVAIAGVGDATCDIVPVQFSEFETDNRLDEICTKLSIERGGGGSGEESYELIAYAIRTHAKLTGLKPGQKGYLIFIGDEAPYPQVSKQQVKEFIGDTIAADIPTADIFRELQEQWHVFFLFPQMAREQRRANIDEEIRKRVIEAGGMHEGVDIRASLLWNTRDDLDLHCVTPAGEHIFYASKVAACGGNLDVDMNAGGPSSDKPVENIRWATGSGKPGKYRVYVQNYAYKSARKPVDFRVELEVNGEVQHFNGTISPNHETGPASDMTAFTFTYDPNARPAEHGDNDVYANYDTDTIVNAWARLIPREHIIIVPDTKGIVDAMLGVIALKGGTRDLDSIEVDMQGRGQSRTRITETRRALSGLAETNALVRVEGAVATRSAEKKRDGSRRVT